MMRYCAGGMHPDVVCPEDAPACPVLTTQIASLPSPLAWDLRHLNLIHGVMTRSCAACTRIYVLFSSGVTVVTSALPDGGTAGASSLRTDTILSAREAADARSLLLTPLVDIDSALPSSWRDHGCSISRML